MAADDFPVRVAAADALTASALESCIRAAPGLAVGGSRPADRGANTGPSTDTTRHTARRRRALLVIDLDHWVSAALDEAEGAVSSGHQVVVLAHRLPPALVRRCVRAGVHAVVAKRLTVPELLAVIVRVAEGEKYVDPRAAAEALAHAECPLTRRERDVMRLIELGGGSSDVADRLHLAVGTVRNLVASACRKIGEPDRTRAAAEALERGWL
jgi:two-component system response regulator DesR